MQNSIFLNKNNFSPKWTKMSDRLTYNNLYYYTYQDWNVNTCNFRETGFGEVLQAILIFSNQNKRCLVAKLR
jgi:hypothetical protein